MKLQLKFNPERAIGEVPWKWLGHHVIFAGLGHWQVNIKAVCMGNFGHLQGWHGLQSFWRTKLSKACKSVFVKTIASLLKPITNFDQEFATFYNSSLSGLTITLLFLRVPRQELYLPWLLTIGSQGKPSRTWLPNNR